jgi:hypothetical protein
LNPHGVHHTPLKRARLPIPPPRHVCFNSIKIIRVCSCAVKEKSSHQKKNFRVFFKGCRGLVKIPGTYFPIVFFNGPYEKIMEVSQINKYLILYN